MTQSEIYSNLYYSYVNGNSDIKLFHIRFEERVILSFFKRFKEQRDSYCAILKIIKGA